MKIAQVCPYNYFRSGGVQTHINHLADCFRKKGHEVKIITPRIKSIENKDKNIICFGASAKVSMMKTQGEISIAIGKIRNPVRELLDKERFDVIHFHEPIVPIMSLQILSESQALNIATYHAAFPNTIVGKSLGTLYLPLAKYMLRFLDGVIAVSEVPAKQLRDISTSKIDIIPNGFDLSIYKETIKPIKKYLDGKVNILFLGRLDKRKGVTYLLRAYRKLKDRFDNVRLIIAGKGNEQEGLDRQIKKYNIQDVEMLGFVSEEEKYRLFKTCDVYCSPALYGESFGIVLLEAMAAGKPVLAFANPGYKTVLKGRGSLLLVKPKDIIGLAEKLEVLCKDKELRDVMGKWGLEEVKQYSWDKVSEQILKYYKEKMSIRKPRKPRNRKTISQLIEKWLKKLNINIDEIENRTSI